MVISEEVEQWDTSWGHTGNSKGVFFLKLVLINRYYYSFKIFLKHVLRIFFKLENDHYKWKTKDDKMKSVVDRNGYHEDLQSCKASTLVLTFSAHRQRGKYNLWNLHCR